MYYALAAGLRAVLEKKLAGLNAGFSGFRAVPGWARAWLLEKFLHL